MGRVLIYLDSSIVLDAIDSNAARHAEVNAALIAQDPARLVVSDLGKMECSIQAIRSKDADRLADIATFFASLTNLLLPSGVFDLAAQLRATHVALRTPDALHLATALHHGCGEFWTNHLRLAKAQVPLALRAF